MEMAAKSVALMCLMNKIKMKLMRDLNHEQLGQIQDSMSLWHSLESDVMQLKHAAINLGVSPEMMASVTDTCINDLLDVWRQ